MQKNFTSEGSILTISTLLMKKKKNHNKTLTFLIYISMDEKKRMPIILVVK